MKQLANGFINNRVLKLNVGFLLGAGPGHTHDITFDAPAVRVAEDVDVTYVRGSVRLSRAKEGILVQGDVHIGVETECARCLDVVQRDIEVPIEELYAYPQPNGSEFFVTDDGTLDLVPLIRAEVLIADDHGVLCREQCAGLCVECGVNLNHEPDHRHEAPIDPRMAKLRELLP
jgi:uncharacterized protein